MHQMSAQIMVIGMWSKYVIRIYVILNTLAMCFLFHLVTIYSFVHFCKLLNGLLRLKVVAYVHNKFASLPFMILMVRIKRSFWSIEAETIHVSPFIPFGNGSETTIYCIQTMFCLIGLWWFL